MDYVAAINELEAKCPLCGQQLREPARFDGERDLYWVTCFTCKTYGITDEVFRFNVLDFVVKPALSGMVRRHFDFTHKPELLTSANCRELASQAPDEKAMYRAKSATSSATLPINLGFPETKLSLQVSQTIRCASLLTRTSLISMCGTQLMRSFSKSITQRFTLNDKSASRHKDGKKRGGFQLWTHRMRLSQCHSRRTVLMESCSLGHLTRR